MMIRLIGIALMLVGIYFLGTNIIFTTNMSPYWWRGIAADASVLTLTAGVFSLFILRGRFYKQLGWVLVITGIVCVFVSSRAVLNPTSLWQFFASLVSFSIGYQIFTTGDIDIGV